MNAPVERIETAGGRVTGVQLAGGEALAAPVVIATVMPQALLEMASLDGWYGKALARFRAGQKLRNDVDDLYEIVSEIRSTVDGHTGTLAEHTRTLADHTRILGEHGRTLDEHTVKLDAILDILRAR